MTTPSNRLLNKTAKILNRVDGTKNEYGEKSSTWTTKVTSFKCAFQEYKGGKQEQLENGQVIIADNVLYCLTSVNILVGDRIEINSVQYEVKYIFNESNRDSHYKVYLKLLS